MTIRAVTFDFWGTLFRDRDSDLRQNLRIERLAHDAGVSQEAARALLDDAIREFARCHIEEQRTLDSRDAVRMAEEAFGTAFAPEKAAGLAHYFSTVILAYPPAPIEDALEAVRSAAARVPVGLISDTGISPGDSLRVVLNRYGFSEHLQCMTFSDEMGLSKPQAAMFTVTAEALGVAPHEILHLGDLEPTDIAGIRALGGTAGLFAGVNPRFLGKTAAEYTFTTWREFIDQLDVLIPGS